MTEARKMTAVGLTSAMAACATLAAIIYVYEATDLEMVSREDIRIDRLTHSAEDGFVAEQHGELVRPGVSRLSLAEGVYHFRSGDDVTLRISDSRAVKIVPAASKDEWPDPAAVPSVWAAVGADEWKQHPGAFIVKGFGSPIPAATLTIEAAE